jgi:hypothetical protein
MQWQLVCAAVVKRVAMLMLSLLIRLQPWWWKLKGLSRLLHAQQLMTQRLPTVLLPGGGLDISLQMTG